MSGLCKVETSAFLGANEKDPIDDRSVDRLC